jgi:hypothetical protein
MGLTCVLWRVTDADVARLSGASAAEVTDFLFGALEREPSRPKGLVGWLKDLSPIRIESAEDHLDAPRGPGQARAELDLDKSWHALHYLFTGTAWQGEEPACFLVQGGTVLGEDADEERLPRVLSRPQVAAFATFLRALDADELMRRFDPARMTAIEIYPEIWSRHEERDQTLAYVLENFSTLRAFVLAAAADGDRLVVMVT